MVDCPESVEPQRVPFKRSPPSLRDLFKEAKADVCCLCFNMGLGTYFAVAGMVHARDAFEGTAPVFVAGVAAVDLMFVGLCFGVAHRVARQVDHAAKGLSTPGLC